MKHTVAVHPNDNFQSGFGIAATDHTGYFVLSHDSAIRNWENLNAQSRAIVPSRMVEVPQVM